MEYPSHLLKFPQEFIWGTADSAFQVEGATSEDGKGPSIWDVFTHTPNRIKNNHNADIACDRYHRYAEDIDIMHQLGVKAHRFSISWPRISPKGDGEINQKGLEFYSKTLDLFEELNVEPWICLYHWDLPQALHERGGWASRESITAFESYVKILAQEFGSRIKRWVILNEPYVVSYLGYAIGMFAPGIQDIQQCIQVNHNLMVAQGKAIDILREYSKGSKIGMSVDVSGSSTYPVSNSAENIETAQRLKKFQLHTYLDPLLLGQYADNPYGIEPIREDDDLESIHKKIDFIGLNYYNRLIVSYDDNPQKLNAKFIPETSGLTELGWKISPEGLYDILHYIDQRYNHPTLNIAENGCAFQDLVTINNIVQDDDRIHYYRDHILEVYRALQVGIDVEGFFAWSLLDNFEWSEGYTKRFGIVHVDFESLERTPKKSFYWYKDVIANNGLTFP